MIDTRRGRANMFGDCVAGMKVRYMSNEDMAEEEITCHACEVNRMKQRFGGSPHRYLTHVCKEHCQSPSQYDSPAVTFQKRRSSQTVIQKHSPAVDVCGISAISNMSNISNISASISSKKSSSKQSNRDKENTSPFSPTSAMSTSWDSCYSGVENTPRSIDASAEYGADVSVYDFGAGAMYV